jgi:hypothetical protein
LNVGSVQVDDIAPLNAILDALGRNRFPVGFVGVNPLDATRQ